MATHSQRPSLHQSHRKDGLHSKNTPSHLNSTLYAEHENHFPKWKRFSTKLRFDDLVDDLVYDMHKGIGGG